MERTYPSPDGKITVHWDSAKCSHCGNCINGLPAVFDLEKRPWVNMAGASSEEIARQVGECPSGALSLEK